MKISLKYTFIIGLCVSVCCLRLCAENQRALVQDKAPRSLIDEANGLRIEVYYLLREKNENCIVYSISAFLKNTSDRCQVVLRDIGSEVVDLESFRDYYIEYINPDQDALGRVLTPSTGDYDFVTLKPGAVLSLRDFYVIDRLNDGKVFSPEEFMVVYEVSEKMSEVMNVWVGYLSVKPVSLEVLKRSHLSE